MASTAESDGPEMLDFEDFKERYQKVPVEEYPNNVLEAVPEPLVSVHVSTYQHADFIRDCLDGVLMQETDFPMEIIIGEDESDDGTREICKEYADRHPDKIRLFLHRRENNISIHGRPTGRFQFTYSQFVARGRYIATCEGDDYWTDPAKLQKQVEFLESNPGYVLSYHDAVIINESDRVLHQSRLPERLTRDLDSQELTCSPVLPTLSMCFKNKLKKFPHEYFNVMNADIMLIALLGRHGKGHYQKDVEPAAYRKHDGGMWTSEEDIFQVRARMHTTRQFIEYCERNDWVYAIKKHKKLYVELSVKRYNLSINNGSYLEGLKCLENILLTYTKFYTYNLSSLYRAARISIGHARKKIVGF